MPTPPIVIAYDGSELAREALRQAAGLFPGSPALVVTVWEPGMAAITTMGSGLDMAGPFPGRFDPAAAHEVDRAVEDRAARVAESGAELGRTLGLAAEAHAIANEANIAQTIVDIATERSAAAVIIGSHGRSGLRSHLLGGTSREILERCRLPIVVVRAP